MKTITTNFFGLKSKKTLAATMMTLMIAAILAPVALAAPPNWRFTASINPTETDAGATDDYTLTITCMGTGGGKSDWLGSATIQIPSGFTNVILGAVTASLDKSWTAELDSGEIILTQTGDADNKLDNGECVEVEFSATAPTPLVTTDYEFTTSGKKNKDLHGPGFGIVGSQPTVTVIVEGDPENNDDEVTYDYETAYAYKDEDISEKFIDYGFANWGWSNVLSDEGSYVFDVWAGAGQCDLTKGILVGTVTVDYGSGTVTVEFNLNPDITLEEYHVYAGSDMFPTGNNGEPTVAPGQYTIASGLSGSIYVIVHAIVGIPQST